MTSPPLLLAVPNVSEGVRGDVIAEIGASFAPVSVLDVHFDPDHGRSVFTVAARQGELAASDPALGLFVTLTRRQPSDWTGFARRVDSAMLSEVGFPPAQRPRIFICGPTGFVEAASAAVVDLGHDPAVVKTERFGPTGG